jgi:hypothetical protein
MEYEEQFTQEILETCLLGLKEGFLSDGIACIGETKTVEEYKKELQVDRRAGQTLSQIETKLTGNKAFLLRQTVAMGGGRLIGVYDSGELAIKQSDPNITNFRWTKTWRTGPPPKGELKLYSHRDALQLPGVSPGRWANYDEIEEWIVEHAYYLPHAPHLQFKTGLVAAAEAVTGQNYIENTNGKVCHALITGPRDAYNRSYRPTVYNHPENGETGLDWSRRVKRDVSNGTILWVKQ